MRSHAYWCKAAGLQGLYIRAVWVQKAALGVRWRVLVLFESIVMAINSKKTTLCSQKAKSTIKEGNSVEHEKDFPDLNKPEDQ